MKRTQPVSVNFPPETYDEIEHEREQEDRSRSNMIVQLVREALAERARKAQEERKE
jgi:metal-responsive CopG/Arc/MetJ family transcriptional regulator